jgi:hypothetical protein
MVETEMVMLEAWKAELDSFQQLQYYILSYLILIIALHAVTF